MFKRHASSNKKLISTSAYAIAFSVPFISFFGETKASKIISDENQFFIKNKQIERFQFTHQSNHNKFNLKSDIFSTGLTFIRLSILLSENQISGLNNI